MKLDTEARARGLTRKGRDFLLLPHKPVRFTAAGPTKPTQTAIADAAECGFAYWGPAPGTGFAWGTDDRQRYHAVHSCTRGGAHQSRHACGLMRQRLLKEINRIAAYAGAWTAPGFCGDIGAEREREILRIRMALANSVWRCDADGPIVEHAGCSTVGVAQVWIEVDQ